MYVFFHELWIWYDTNSFTILLDKCTWLILQFITHLINLLQDVRCRCWLCRVWLIVCDAFSFCMLLAFFDVQWRLFFLPNTKFSKKNRQFKFKNIYFLRGRTKKSSSNKNKLKPSNTRKQCIYTPTFLLKTYTFPSRSLDKHMKWIKLQNN